MKFITNPYFYIPAIIVVVLIIIGIKKDWFKKANMICVPEGGIPCFSDKLSCPPKSIKGQGSNNGLTYNFLGFGKKDSGYMALYGVVEGADSTQNSSFNFPISNDLYLKWQNCQPS